MSRKIRYQSERSEPGKHYVCEVGLRILTPLAERRLAGPFDSAEEAAAALGALEAEHPQYQARTEVWLCQLTDTEPSPPMFTTAASPEVSLTSR